MARAGEAYEGRLHPEPEEEGKRPVQGGEQEPDAEPPDNPGKTSGPVRPP